MRFMIIGKATPESEKEGFRHDPKLLLEMGKYNEELMKAGVVLAMDGLHPSSKGKRITFTGAKPTITDGPFTETKEVVAGFWVWQVRNIEGAVEWLKRSPFGPGAEVEIRQIFEMEDFAPVLSEEQIQHKVAKRAELPHQTVNR